MGRCSLNNHKMGLLKNACFWSRGTIRRNEQSSKSTSYQGESDRLKKKEAFFNRPKISISVE